MTTPADLQALGLADDPRDIETPIRTTVVVDEPVGDSDTTDARGDRTLVIEGGATFALDAASASVAKVELDFASTGPAFAFPVTFPLVEVEDVEAAAADLDQPQENGSGGTSVGVGASGDQRIDGILSGVRWAQSFITYSDPDSQFDYQAGHPELFSNFQQINAAQLQTTHAALNSSVYSQPFGGIGNSVEGFTNLTIDYAGSGSGAGTIRLANTSNPGTAYARYPGNGVAAGDVFFGPSGRSPVTGNYDYYTVVHELGHSLGLKHGHETGTYGALPFGQDSMEYSIMTYKSYVGSDAQFVYNEQWGYAQTFMMFDIAALQYMYGADFTTNAGNTVYTWNQSTGQSFVNGAVALTPGGNRIFQTIWDGGGTDTYDLSNYTTNLAIDLSPGGHSTFSSAQRAYLGGGPNGGYARGNVFNALQYQGNAASLIENAVGGSGNDMITGNVANNVLTGNGGADALFGGAGGDALYGGSGADTLRGGSGSDYLDGGTGADDMDAGDGNDTYIVDDEADVAAELFGDALGGVDWVYASADFTLSANLENLVLTGTSATNGAGNARDNLIYGSGARNIMSGAAGNDTIYGGAGNDDIYGGDGTDILYGGDGNDIINGGLFVDTSYGGEGDDTFRVSSNHNADNVYGGNGTDTLDMSGFTYSGVVVNLATGTYDYVPAGGPFTASSIERVIGTNFADTITGDTAANAISGRGGADVLYGGGGTDSVYGGDGNDLVAILGGDGLDNADGGAGVDTLDYSDTAGAITFNLLTGAFTYSGNARTATAFENFNDASGNGAITGTAGANVLRGFAGNDVLYGGAGTDTLEGGDGADTLYGGTENDVMRGGLGNDIYYVGSGGDQTIETVGGAAGGVDRVNSSVSRTLGANIEDLWLSGTAVVGTGNSLGNTINGTDFANTLSGNDGDDFIFGFGGADVLFGGNGIDRLDAGSGNDTVRGDVGNDNLIGNLGADILIGGVGNDTFRYLQRADTGIGAAADRIRGEGGVAAFEGAGAGALDVIHLGAIDANEVLAGDQSFVFGTAQTIGRLWATTVGTDTHIRGNVNAVAGYDFEIIIEDGGVLASAYASGDFVL